MSRYEFFESGVGLTAAKLGIITVDLLTKYDSYKTYREFLDAGNDAYEAKLMASERCRCHYTTIIRAIHWFERPAQQQKERVRSLKSQGQLNKNAN